MILCIQYSVYEVSTCIFPQQFQQVIERGLNVTTTSGMVGFNSNDGIGSFGLGRALFTLSPSPAPGNHQAGFIGKHYLAWPGILYSSLTQRCIPFGPAGTIYGDV